MDEPEDKGPRYRWVMFVAIVAIVGPGFFLLNWIGDNGVGRLFSSFLGLDQPRPRVTRTASPSAAPTVVVVAATSTAIPTASATGAAPTASVASPSKTATRQPTRVPVTPTAVPVPPTTAPVPTTPPPPPPATATARPAPTPTPEPPVGLGYGTAVPAYGGAAVIRAKPTTDSQALGSIPLGDQVFVVRIVEGEAIDPVESRWWEVDYGGIHGFVYHKLITLN